MREASIRLTGRSGKKQGFKKVQDSKVQGSGLYKDEHPTLNIELPTSNQRLEKIEHRISINETKY